jgi:hypothetical protein
MDGVDVFRMNQKGEQGLWACDDHKDQFDGRVPDEVRGITNALSNDQKSKGK